uniref:Tc1-like transposase DDE domain-containing protein n=1 Tax=Esox lucius TaxID=8010 RepID=A0AAY5LAD8_ESOLU
MGLASSNRTLPTTQAKLWLEEHLSEFGVLPFPPKSLDLNVIEHIWDAMQHVWCSLPTEYFCKLVESIPHGISAVLSLFYLWPCLVISPIWDS